MTLHPHNSKLLVLIFDKFEKMCVVFFLFLCCFVGKFCGFFDDDLKFCACRLLSRRRGV